MQADVNITTYKGFQITFDVQTGKFIADSATREGKPTFESSSFNSIKKAINDFIKENISFGEFKIRPKVDFGWRAEDALEVSVVKGITSQRKLVVTDIKTEKTKTLSKYDVGRFYIHDPKLDEAVKVYIEKKKKIDKEYQKALSEIESPVRELDSKSISLKEYIEKEGIEVNLK